MAQPSVNFHAPYKDPANNYIYNLLFCDDAALWMKDAETGKSPITTVILAEPTDVAAIKHIAENENMESRYRALAYNRLRQLNVPVAPKVILGVIVEIGLNNGLDTLAIFRDSRIRYINQTGRLGVIESRPELLPPPLMQKIRQLFTLAQPVVGAISPSNKEREAAPERELSRLTFLTSDGLYFLHGKMTAIGNEVKAGPVMGTVTEILLMVVGLLKKHGQPLPKS